MRKMSLELSVGAFVVVALALFGYFAVRIGQADSLGGGAYELTAQFTDVGGLKRGAEVVIAGVPIGRVARVGVLDYRANVVMAISGNVKVHDDASAAVRSRGLLGETLVEITPGSSGVVLRPGERIRETQPALDLYGLVSEVTGGSSQAASPGGSTYELTARFTDVGGLKRGADVAIAGVPIGRVKQVSLHDYRANVLMAIAGDVRIQEDAIATVKTRGLLGGTVVEITPGGSELDLKPGERIRETQPALDLYGLVAKYIFEQKSGGGIR
ncbi:MAG: MCE family protein [Planctomycetes bacterium]|nr:MCE family protein [Planctomycetota bacterium]